MADKALEGRTVLVTGSSKGIGAATAKALAAQGAHVILTGRDVRTLEAVEDAIHEAGGASTIAPVDLTETDGIARLANAIAGRWDTLDGLVIAAAYLPTLTPVTPSKPSAGSALSIVAPAGSAMPPRSLTSTNTSNSIMSSCSSTRSATGSGPVGEGPACDSFIGLHIP